MNVDRILTAALAGSLLLAAAACSSGAKQNTDAKTSAPGPAAGQPHAPDACALVTKAEVAQAVGTDAGDPVLSSGQCQFLVGKADSIALQILPGSAAAADATAAALKSQNMPVTETSGIGERAFFVGVGSGVTSLYAYKGDHYVMLNVNLSNAAEAKQHSVAEELMRKAIGRL